MVDVVANLKGANQLIVGDVRDGTADRTGGASADLHYGSPVGEPIEPIAPSPQRCKCHLSYSGFALAEAAHKIAIDPLRVRSFWVAV